MPRRLSFFAWLGLVAVPMLFCSACQWVSMQSKPLQMALWPETESPVTDTTQLEHRIEHLLAQLSLEQKVAQMIQVEIASVTPEDITQYRLGAVLSGGGQPPDHNPNADADYWVAHAEKLYQAAMKPAAGQVPIPLMWGVDAVHGHGNFVGATLFPHNHGLGATGNADLVQAIGRATALEVAATGLDWNFAPSVGVARDYRWGRTYESFSEDPQQVALLGAAAIRGLQGQANDKEFLDDRRVIATAKHFLGDGGTAFGDDQGETLASEREMIDVHLPGYKAAVEAGVQTIMASFSGWRGVNSHANRALLRDVLKNQLGFDGVVISDWQGIAQIPGCTLDSCPQAINAGVDMFMIPKTQHWRDFYRNTLAQVADGQISEARIDDAVRRILRVKMRAGLWRKGSPASRPIAGQADLIGSAQQRALARQAVRESLVLLKNNGVLPLDPTQTILVTGAGAHNIAMQAGGWSVTWQGRDNDNARYPGATSIYQGIARTVAAAGGRAILSETGNSHRPFDAAVVVFGEPPYAEMYGDIQNLDTLEIEREYKRSLAILRDLKTRGVPVVALLLSGRPMWVNKELNWADAFVAAWLPGSEGAGVADVILGNADGSVNHEFQGQLPFSWPAMPCQARINQGDPDYAPLFPLGFGLTYRDRPAPWQPLAETTAPWRFGCRLGGELPPAKRLRLRAKNHWQFFAEASNFARNAVAKRVESRALRVEPGDRGGNGVIAKWSGMDTARVTLRHRDGPYDLLPQLAHQSAISLSINVHRPPTDRVYAVMTSGALTDSRVDITEALGEMQRNQWQRLSIALTCFSDDRIDMSKVDVPFGLETRGAFKASIVDVSLEPGTAQEAVIQCH